MKTFTLLLSLSLLATACSNTESQGDNAPTPNPEEIPSTGVELDVDTREWATLTGEFFTVKAPSGWILTPDGTAEVYAVEISGDGLTLTFNYGSGIENLFEDRSAEFIASEESINEKMGTVYFPKASPEGEMGLYIEVSAEEALFVTTEAKSINERVLLLEILRSVSFEGSFE